MDWFGADVDGPLVVIRAIHFAATTVTVGTLIFRSVVEEPALRLEEVAAVAVRRQSARVAWVGLAIALASGVIWFLVQTMAMSGLPFGDAISSDVLSTVLNETQFGLISKMRFGLAIVVAVRLVFDRLPRVHWLGLAAALAFIASVAWTGHAGSTQGQTGMLHLAADALHLAAAAAWIGGLVPLVLLLHLARCHQAPAWVSLARDVAQRFSTLGIVSVGTLSATGIINAGILVGSFHALLVTTYGELLMLKVGVFAVMVGVAAINRYWLTPRLVHSSKDSRLPALQQLTRNSIIEIALGFVIFAIVGVLGTLHPAIHGA
jgi:putative copper resistance protein D